MALINELRNMGDAVRERAGLTELMTIEQMADAVRAIPQPVVEDIKITKNGTYTPPIGVDGFDSVEVEVQGTVDVEPTVLTGNLLYGCAGALGSQYVKLFGDSVSTEDVNTCSYMFYNFTGEHIPFDINLLPYANSLTSMFNGCENLKTLPNLNNCRPLATNNMFYQCKSLIEIADGWCNEWDWEYSDTQTSSYAGDASYMFNGCNTLRYISREILEHKNPNAAQSYSYYYYGFTNCYVLDALALPIPYTTATWKGNAFVNTFNYCYRLKSIVFDTNEDGTPKVVKWQSQAIDLSNVGVLSASLVNYILEHNSGITADKEVYDDATYAALKDDADWFTLKVEYSRYNHDSAVATINSLPDCSATGTNTIKFKGTAGSLTDGGAINTLTEAEIAVAAAKGWTVSLT